MTERVVEQVMERAQRDDTVHVRESESPMKNIPKKKVVLAGGIIASPDTYISRSVCVGRVGVCVCVSVCVCVCVCE